MVPGHPLEVKKGDIVTFDFHVKNEGTLPVYGLTLIDTLPPGLEVAEGDTNGWIATGDRQLRLDVKAIIQPGEEYVAHLDVLVTADQATLLTNYAEITELFGPGGETVVDWDEETGDMESDATIAVGAPETDSGQLPQQLNANDKPSAPSKLPNMAKTGAAIGGVLGFGALSVALGLVLMRRRRTS